MPSRVNFISYGTPAFYPALFRLAASARKHGLSHINLQSPYLVAQSPHGADFQRRNSRILRLKRGGGYWVWKPYIILEALKQAADGDVIIYSDAGVEIIAPLSPLIQIAQTQPIMLFSNRPHINREWTKRDTFILLDADTPRFHDAPQVMSGFLVLRNSEETRRFIGEWLRAIQDERAVTDMPNTLGKDNFPEFREHRHDQSILSILAVRDNIEIYRDPSQWGNRWPMENSPFPQMLNVHRKRYKGMKLLNPRLFIRWVSMQVYFFRAKKKRK